MSYLWRFFQRNDEKLKKVCYHDHTTGLYVGTAHKHCNFLRSFTLNKNTNFFHKSQGYDSHFIIDEIPRSTKIDKLEIIPKPKINIYRIHLMVYDLKIAFHLWPVRLII